MGRSAFVDVPSTVQLNLPGEEGWWVEVKERLTYGEEQKLANSSLTSVMFSQANQEAGLQEIGLDMRQHAFMRILTWVTDWNLSGSNGKTMPFNRSAVENLNPDVAADINAALDEHVKALEGKDKSQIIEATSRAKSS